MAFQRVVNTQVDYDLYRFGRSRQVFRGPPPDLSGRYIACIGGAETFGKFSPIAYPEVVEEEFGLPCANWGTPGAGPGFFLKDPVLLDACSRAEVCVISVMSAHTLSNRLFSVYPRRNERLRSVSEMMTALYPEVEFDQFRFVGNMLQNIYAISAQRFNVVALEIRNAWLARMREMLADIESRKILLWFSDHHPVEGDPLPPMQARQRVPGFIDREMLKELAPLVDVFVEYVAEPEAAEGQSENDRLPNLRGPEAARRFPSKTMHLEVAELLSNPIDALLTRTEATREEVLERSGFWRKLNPFLEG